MATVLWSFDSVVLAAVAADLAPLVGSAVARVGQPDRDEIVLTLRGRTGQAHLLYSIHPRWARVHLIGAAPAGLPTPAAFCQLLRARLDGARLRAVLQPDFERTVSLDFDTDDGTVTLIAEVMGRHSNLIAVRDHAILGSLKAVTARMSSVRQILPGLRYVPPPRDRPTPPELTRDALRIALAESTGTTAQRLARSVLGLSPRLAAELVTRAGLAPSSPPQSADEDADALWPVLTDVIDTVRARRFAPVVYRVGDTPVGFAPFPYVHQAGRHAVSATTMSEAVATVAARATVQSRLEERRTVLRALIISALAKVTHTQVALHQARADADRGEELRRQGDLLLAYASQISPQSTEATLPGFDGHPVTIALDPALTPVENARRLFERYSRLKAAQPTVERRLREMDALVDYLDSAVTMADTATSIDDLAAVRAELVAEGILPARRTAGGPAAKTGPRTFVTSAGHRVIVGRSNVENDRVTFTLARLDDVWLHARGVPGAHAVLKAPVNVSEDDIREAAQIAAYFSRARGAARVAVSYTLRKYIKKPRGARPGLVTISNERTIVVEPKLPEPVR